MVPSQYLQADEKEVMLHPWPWYRFEYTACPASCDETPHLLPDTPALGVMSAGQYTFHFGTNENLPNRPSPVTTTAPSKVPALIQTGLEQITNQDGRVEQSTTLLAVAERREDGHGKLKQHL